MGGCIRRERWYCSLLFSDPQLSPLENHSTGVLLHSDPANIAGKWYTRKERRRENVCQSILTRPRMMTPAELNSCIPTQFSPRASQCSRHSSHYSSWGQACLGRPDNPRHTTVLVQILNNESGRGESPFGKRLITPHFRYIGVGYYLRFTQTTLCNVCV
jgi:hypothetical protein